MESKRDLVRIGQEGFAMLDQYYSHKKQNPPILSKYSSSASQGSQNHHACHYRYHPQKLNVYQINPGTAASQTTTMVFQNHVQAKKKDDLEKIGLEGFALLDQYYYGKKSQPAQRYVYQMKPAYAK